MEGIKRRVHIFFLLFFFFLTQVWFIFEKDRGRGNDTTIVCRRRKRNINPLACKHTPGVTTCEVLNFQTRRRTDRYSPPQKQKKKEVRFFSSSSSSLSRDGMKREKKNLWPVWGVGYPPVSRISKKSPPLLGASHPGAGASARR